MRNFFRLSNRGIFDLFQTPVSTLMTFAAITLTAFLAGMLLLLVSNLDRQLISIKGDFAYQVYWEADASMAEVKAQWKDMEGYSSLSSMKVFTPEQAMNELAKSLRNVDGIRSLRGSSTLPPTALLYFSPAPAEAEQFSRSMLAKLQALPGVASVHYDALQLELVHSWAKLSKTLFWPLLIMLLAATALLQGNTMKLSMLTRQEEIEILSLVGASDMYIRWPLAAGSAFLALCASFFALGLIQLATMLIAQALSAPPFQLTIHPLSLGLSLSLVAIITTVGILCGWFSFKPGK